MADELLLYPVDKLDGIRSILAHVVYVALAYALSPSAAGVLPWQTGQVLISLHFRA